MFKRRHGRWLQQLRKPEAQAVRRQRIKAFRQAGSRSWLVISTTRFILGSTFGDCELRAQIDKANCDCTRLPHVSTLTILAAGELSFLRLSSHFVRVSPPQRRTLHQCGRYEIDSYT